MEKIGCRSRGRSVKVWQVVPLAPQVEAPRLQALQALWETQTEQAGSA